MDPSSEEVANCVNCGWNAIEVILLLCPFISYLGGCLSMNKSEALVLVAFLLGSFYIYYLSPVFSYSSFVIFF